MNIVLLEPFYSGSHKSWANSLKRKSSHNIEILGIDNKSWKNAMLNGAKDLAKLYIEKELRPDLILSNDLVDLKVFKQNLNLKQKIAIYFHENQINYPWSKYDKNLEVNKKLFGEINYTSALLADKCFFNSAYHLNAFIDSLDFFLDTLKDKEISIKKNIKNIKSKSEVLYLGLDLTCFDQYKDSETNKHKKAPVILWNHRWAYDKNPKDFFNILKILKKRGLKFRLIIIGEHFHQGSVIFVDAKRYFKDEIIHYGYVEKFSDYAKLLHQADIIPVTSNQDFFGASIVEAIYCGVRPLLPNRLSYKELVPADFIYLDNTELISKLENLLLSKEVDSNLSKYVKRFDWSEMIKVYDQKFNELL